MNKRLDKRGASYLLAICWIVYFCSYLGRLNYSSVMSELIGTVLTLSFVCSEVRRPAGGRSFWGS